MPKSKRDKGYTISMTIPSNVHMLGVIDKVLEGLSEHLALNHEEQNALAIAVIEAGTNAIQHGNHYDETKPVDLKFQIDPKRILVTVKDMGRGFDLSKVEEDLACADLLRCRGRGIHIMRELMDEVGFAFSKRGTTVTLAKALPPRGGDGDGAE
jgi:serine/threonine-protein kinase RsbW